MHRTDRLLEARDVLLQNYLGFWGEQKIPVAKVQMELLLIDLVDQLLEQPDAKGDSVINRNKMFTMERDDSRGDGTTTSPPVLEGDISRSDGERAAQSGVRDTDLISSSPGSRKRKLSRRKV